MLMHVDASVNVKHCKRSRWKIVNNVKNQSYLGDAFLAIDLKLEITKQTIEKHHRKVLHGSYLHFVDEQRKFNTLCLG